VGRRGPFFKDKGWGQGSIGTMQGSIGTMQGHAHAELEPPQGGQGRLFPCYKYHTGGACFLLHA